MILVTGASGYIGSRAVRRLLELGLPVTALGRDEARLRQAVPRETPVVIADYDDPESLDRAFAKVRKLLFVASDGFATDMTRQHANVIEAANRRQIAHVAFTSIVDVADGSPFYFAPVYRDAERLLKASRFATSIIRCGLYCEFIHQHWLKDPVISLPLANAQIAPVSRDDVAAAAVESLLHPAPGTRDLTGSRSYSMTELAQAAMSALNRKFTYRACTQGEYLARLEAEMPPPWPIAFATLCASVREGRYSAVSTRHLEMLSHRAEDFEGYLQRHARTSREPVSFTSL